MYLVPIPSNAEEPKQAKVGMLIRKMSKKKGPQNAKIVMDLFFHRRTIGERYAAQNSRPGYPTSTCLINAKTNMKKESGSTQNEPQTNRVRKKKVKRKNVIFA